MSKTLQYCIRCGVQLNIKMGSKTGYCRPCNCWVIAQRRRKPTPQCIDCGKKVSRMDVKRCRKCMAKEFRKNPPMVPGKLDKNPAWKGGKTITKRRYVFIKKPNHPFANNRGYIFEHRLEIEKHIGRYLLPNEVVHHINGIKSDNRIENLKLYPRHSKHVHQHHTKHLKPRPRNSITGRFM